ncbi:MAG TPA: hypothetical protein VKR53_00690 [Puia sp.]|nr:hypothetical protein [Puia sp.]
MKIVKINTSAAGTWARDCELIYLTQHKGFKINYHRDEDDTYWSIQCERIIAYKVINEEFSTTGYLINLPVEGAFFEILDSPWIREFGQEKDRILDECKHYIFRFYDETIEIIAQDFVFEQLKEKPA